jgi:hypothetical protein
MEHDTKPGRGESSPGPGDEPPLVFYYSRERRLSRASEQVRELNEAAPVKRPGLIGALTANRSGAMVFVSIVALSIFFIIYSLFMPKGSQAKLGENSVSVSAMGFPEATYIAVKKKSLGERSYTGTVDIAVSIPAGKNDSAENAPIVTHRVFFTLEPEEDFRFSVPFMAAELILAIQAGEELITLRVKPE